MAPEHDLLTERKTVLLDATNLAMRSYHAAKHTGMSGGGQATGALLLFVNSLSKILAGEKPTHFVACWDGGGSDYREELFPEYKLARRQAAAESPPPMGSFMLIKEFMVLSGLPGWQMPRVEADDLIAAAHRITNGRKVILSADKDLLQLLDEHTEQIRFTGDIHEDRWDAARVQAHYGCPPRHLPYLMALTGDQADGIPGVRGVGPKKATKMLADVGWNWVRLESTLSVEQRQQAELSLALIDLRHVMIEGLPPVFGWDAHPRFGVECNADGDCGRCQEIIGWCEAYELDSIVRRIESRTLWP